MDTETNKTEPLDVVLTVEAQKKLNHLVDEVWAGIADYQKKLPEKKNAYVKSLQVETKLQEDGPDVIVVTILFRMAFATNLFKTSIEVPVGFEIPCLSENIRKQAKAEFKKTFETFVTNFALFISAWADSYES